MSALRRDCAPVSHYPNMDPAHASEAPDAVVERIATKYQHLRRRHLGGSPAEDIFQNALVALWQRLQRAAVADPDRYFLRAWRNGIREWCRRQRRLRRRLGSPIPLEDAAPAARPRRISEGQYAEMMTAVGALPPAMRDDVLCYLQEGSCQRAADRLSATRGAIWHRLRGAVKVLAATCDPAESF